MRFENWGLVDYQTALEKQLMLVEEVAAGGEEVVVFCTHPPVATLGRATKPDDITTWQGPRLEVSRGGRVTYHGPSQLVVYPILNLNHARRDRKARDLVGYIRDFEDSIVDVLTVYGVESTGRSLQKMNKEQEVAQEETGVWTQVLPSRKIASLGIAVKKWVTYHGAAINLDRDPEAFLGMRPCGFEPHVMVSLEELVAKKIPRVDFETHLRDLLAKKFTT